MPRRDTAQQVGAVFVWACGGALVIADRRSLSAAASTAGYRPAGFLGTLQLLMVLALADAQTLGLFATFEYDDRHSHPTSAFFFFAATALLYVVGFVGLYNLALWGVVATMGSAAVVVTVVFTRAVHLEGELRAPLYALSAVQLALPLPMLLSMVTRRPLPTLPARVRDVGSTVVVALIVLVASAFALGR